MSIWGKILGPAAGLALGGPVGGLLGLVVGAAVDVGVERVAGSKDPTRSVAFTIGVVALAAKMAKADGRVTKEELQAFRQVFRVAEADMPAVSRVFRMAQQHSAGYQAYARQISALLADRRLLLEDLLDGLFYIALADGELHQLEIDFLGGVARIFGFSESEFAVMLQRYGAVAEDDPYRLLGISADASDAEVKSAYRDLVRRHHPDRMMAEGVPPDMIAVATSRAAEINIAYARIMEARRPPG